MIQAVTSAQNDSAGQYAQAGGLATEMLSGIRTVTALNAQPDAITRYRKFILKAMDIGLIKGFKVGLGNGLTFCCSFFTYALGFWYGAKLIADQNQRGCTENCLTGGTVIAVFFCVIIGASALGQLAPPMGAFFAAKAAAGSVMEVLNRKPLIDGLSEEGEKPASRPKGACVVPAFISRRSLHCKKCIFNVDESVTLTDKKHPYIDPCFLHLPSLHVFLPPSLFPSLSLSYPSLPSHSRCY